MERKTLDKFEVRIENLSIRKAVYLLDPKDYPKHPSYHIDKWQENPYYKHEADYEWSEDGSYAYGQIDGKTDKHWRINRNMFDKKETCYAVASFDYDEHEDFYELRFNQAAPLDLDEHEREIFWELIKIGYKTLNNDLREED